MFFKMIHENYNVKDLEVSMAFYEKALGLHEVRRNEAADGEVRFSAGYAVNELKHDVKQVHAELRYVSPDGEKTSTAMQV